MNMKFTIATVALASVLSPAIGRAQIGGGVFICSNCATEPTQISIKLMHDLEYAKQILQSRYSNSPTHSRTRRTAVRRR
jgi:hypothetical protein